MIILPLFFQNPLLMTCQDPHCTNRGKLVLTVEEKCLCTICSVWSKTTLITGGVGGTGVNPPSCKMGTFFLGSLALNVPIYRNFQSNGANLWSFKLWKEKFCIIGY